MITTLENKLYQYELIKKDQSCKIFIYYFMQEIVEIIKKIRDRQLFYCLTPHERKVAEEIEDKYRNSNKIF